MARQADKRLPVTFRQGQVIVVLLLVLGMMWVMLSEPNRLGTMLGEASLQEAGERRSLARDGAGHDAGAASGDAGAAFAETSAEIDPYLRIPAVVQRPNAHLVKPYKRMQKGLRLTYRGNRFSANQPDLIWVPEVTRDRYKLRWETLGKKVEGAGLAGVFPGNVLRILDDELYDFGVGTLFVRVLNETSGKSGYTLYETIIGDCDPADEQLWVARDVPGLLSRVLIEVDEIALYRISQPRDPALIDDWIDILGDPTRYRNALNGGIEGAGVHPVYAANVATAVLMELVERKHPEKRRSEILWAVRRFFDRWAIPHAERMPGDTVSWPYNFPWTTYWGIRLDPPWYSAYANARMALNAALLYRLTEHESYRRLARRAAGFVALPIEEGGAQYEVLGFKLPAEYVYPSPPIPNVRVLDGELIVIAALFNGARLLGDSDLLRLFMTQVGSLAMQMESYRRPNGDLEFAMYIEDLPAHYRWDVWSALQILANASKDRRFSILARDFAKHVPDERKESNGS